MSIVLPVPVAVESTESAHHARWVEVIEALMTHADPELDVIRAYGWDDVPGHDDNPGPSPYQHWQVAVTRTSRHSEPTMGGRVGRIRWRLDALAVAPSVAEVRAMRDRLNLIVLTRAPFLTGSRLEPYDADTAIDKQDDVWAGGVTWDYATDRRVPEET